MGNLLLLMLALAAIVISTVLIIKWARSRRQPPRGFPIGRVASDMDHAEERP